MRYFMLATAERRPRRPFQLTDITGRKKIGIMTYNPATARHELELPEEQYAQSARDIALASRLPGFCVFMAGIRDTARIPEVVEFEAGFNLAMDGRPLPDEASDAARAGHEFVRSRHFSETQPPGPLDRITDEAPRDREIDPPEVTAKTPNFELNAIAKAEGVDISEITGPGAAARKAEAINTARRQKQIQTT